MQKIENVLCDAKNTQLEHMQKCQYEYVMASKSILDNKLFAKGFDTWTVGQQYKWINKNLQKLYPNTPESLLHLIPALFRQDNSGRSQLDKPVWLDLQKYRKGQEFVHNYYTPVIGTSMLSLLHAYSFSDEIKPLILGANSHTPYLAFKRFMSTQPRILSWYEGEPWIQGTRAYKNMQFTRRIHDIIRTKASRLNKDEYVAMYTFANPWCPDRELLLKDFTAACPVEKPGQLPFKIFANSPYWPKPLSHADIAGLQYALAGMLILYPCELGAHGATDEELEAFCHMWRCYGYLLGIDDEYNFCRGSLEDVRQRVRDLGQHWIIPGFKYASSEWEHITRCFIASMNYFPLVYIPYKSAIIFDMDILGINMSNLYASLNYSEWAAYYICKFVVLYVMKPSFVRMFINKIMKSLMIQMMNLSPEKKVKFHEKSKKQIDDFSITNGNC